MAYQTSYSQQSSRRSRGAFSLIELLITVGIVAVIAGLLLPAVTRVRESARRATDLSNLRQLVGACLAYAGDCNGDLPPGRVSFAPPGQDNYTWLNYKNCWQPLIARSPALTNILSCGSVMNFDTSSDDFGTAGSEYGRPDDTQVGWIYWGGRDDLIVDGALKYRSMHRLAQHVTPGSQTLWTCLCWDSAGNKDPYAAWDSPNKDSSIAPHIGSAGAMYPLGTAFGTPPLKPAPDGLGIALDDGSASFVAWNDMITIPQANGYKLYYQP